MTRTPASARAALLLLGTAAVTASAPVAHAQSAPPQEAFELQLFRPAVSPDDGLGAPGSQGLSRSEFAFSMVAHWDHNPLTVISQEGEEGVVVGDQFNTDITGGFGLLDWLEVGVVVPVIWMQTGDDLSAPASGSVWDGSNYETGLGDVSLLPRLTLVRRRDQGVGLALAGDLRLPSGDQRQFRSDGAVRGAISTTLDYAWAGGPVVALTAGYGLRPALQFEGYTVSDQLEGALLVAVPVASRVRVLGEAQVAAGINTPGFDEYLAPAEARLGIDWRMSEAWSLQSGVGTALSHGFGAPVARGIVGVSWSGAANGDRDGDGWNNDADNCPDEREDMDGFVDGDGCPDVDNDNDGVPDARDQAPDEAEDKDGFEDGDGRPDPDNDNDDLRDLDDRTCPNEPEDWDNVKDDDGCPDPDNDADGILDHQDREPNAPEDKDGFEDDDGAPEPDNDRDSIADGLDRCLNEAETYNGVDDTDGCPDQGGNILVTCDRIQIGEKVFFDTGAATIQARSNGLLNLLAQVMKSARHLKKLQVLGFTDDRGDDDANRELSRRRAEAVMSYLVAQGVEASRLVADGRGEAEPIADNATAAGRGANRRVEFRILEQESRCP